MVLFRHNVFSCIVRKYYSDKNLGANMRSVIYYFCSMILLAFCSYSNAAGGNILGNGMASNPYLLEDEDDFYVFADPNFSDAYWAANTYVRLESDIDLTGIIFNRPVIGFGKTSSSSIEGKIYYGRFDGNGHIISNITINPDSEISNYIGFFGYLGVNSRVKNLGIKNIHISSSDQYFYGTGGLCGGGSTAEITNCYVSGLINYSSNLAKIGGFFGSISDSFIEQCYSEVNISCTGRIQNSGGFYGSATNSTVDKCYSTGDIVVGDQSYAIGGFLGAASDSTTSNCYTTGDVTCGKESRYVGGFCGITAETISCYSAGSMSIGQNSYFVLGFGARSSKYQKTNCYYYEYTGPDLGGAETPLSSIDMGDSASYIGFDFAGNSTDGPDDIWDIIPGYCPKLAWQNGNGPALPNDIVSTTLTGSGTSLDPFLINDKTDFSELCTNTDLWLRELKLTADIDYAGDVFDISLCDLYFCGVLDGNGKSIRNLTIEIPLGTDIDDIGIFGSLTGTVKNLTVDNISISADALSANIGAICGNNLTGKIINCNSTGLISGGDAIGGLSGKNSGEIDNCYSEVNVTGNKQVGGLCGYNYDKGIITNSYAVGAVTGAKEVGGFCGVNDALYSYDVPLIELCYSTGMVNGILNSENVGTFCGYNQGLITKCYTNGDLICADGSFDLGGFLGFNEGGTVSESYSAGTITLGDNCYRIGGFLGYTKDRSKQENCYSISTVNAGEAAKQIGGFCGQTDNVILRYCYYLGELNIREDTQNVGAFCGNFIDNEYYTNTCYYYFGITPFNNQGNPLYDNEIVDSTKYVGFDFVGNPDDGTDDIWAIEAGRCPKLAWQTNQGSEFVPLTIDTTLDGTGNVDDPFIISDPAKFQEFVSNNSLRVGCYRLDCDIDWASQPINGYLIDGMFGGYFDGNGHIIRNINTDGGGVFNGVFQSNYGQISGLILEDVNIDNGSNCIAGICERNYGIITNCEVTITINTPTILYIGGVCGENRGVISQCEVDANLTGNNYTGGICGISNSGEISNCRVSGNIIGSDYTGGICGSNSGIITNSVSECLVSGAKYTGGGCGQNGGQISFSFAAGDVSGTDFVGGFCGYNSGDDNDYSYIDNCYSVGNVSGINRLGGFCGSMGYGYIDKCYTTGEIQYSTLPTYVGGFCSSGGSANITECYYYFMNCGPSKAGIGLDDVQMVDGDSYVGFDFADVSTDGDDDIWTIIDGHCPVFAWQQLEGPVIEKKVLSTSLHGSGTSYDPFQINNASDLDEFVNNNSLRIGFYELNTDVNVSGGVTALTETYDSAVIDEPFGGSFDGNGHIINGISFNITDNKNSNVGMFSMNYGQVSSLSITDYTISSSIDITFGGICGRLEGGILDDCFASGNIEGNYSYAGGLCGYNTFGRISNSSADVVIVSPKEYFLGGLCGYGVNCSFFNSHSTGSITGRNHVGGFAGNISNGTIDNCFSSCIVSGYDNIGGLCGVLNGVTSNCYSNGCVIGHEYVGGLAGYAGSTNQIARGTISSCYSLSDVTGTWYVGGLFGNSSSAINKSSYNGNVTGNSYVGGFCGQNYGGDISDCYSAGTLTGYSYAAGFCGRIYGTGTIENCYSVTKVTITIKSATCPAFCDYPSSKDYLNCYFYALAGGDNGIGVPLGNAELQNADSYLGFDFAGNTSDGDEDIWVEEPGYCPRLSWQIDNWVAIPTKQPSTLSGSGSQADPFLIRNVGDFDEFVSNSKLRFGYYQLANDIDLSGKTYTDAVIDEGFGGYFDGNSFKLSNLTIDTTEDCVGLFAFVSGTISDLHLENVLINTSGGCAGGLCGQNKGLLLNCQATGCIYSEGESTGGICGKNDENGVIENCSMSGEVSGDNNTGGICGYSYKGKISSCSSDISVIGSDNTGGVCGYHEYGEIAKCESGGEVYGYERTGGMCGYIQGTITNSNSSSSVSGRNKTGGFGGENTSGVKNCFSTGDVTVNSSYGYVGGFIGNNSRGLVEGCYASGNVNGGYYIGGFCGANTYSTYSGGVIRSSWSGGDVCGSDNVGGFCGYNAGGGTNLISIENCYSIANVIGDENVGGFCGKVYSYKFGAGYIKNCYARGSTYGTNTVGGFCGYVSYSSIYRLHIIGCFSIGEVDGYIDVYGFCGYINKGEITDCYWDVEKSGQESGYDYNLDEYVNVTNLTELKTNDLISGEIFELTGWDFALETANGEEDIWLMYGPYPGFEIWSSGYTLMPDVIGMSEANARLAIAGAGLIVGDVEYSYNLNHEAEQVYMQSPAADMANDIESGVCMRVSLGDWPFDGDGTEDAPYLISDKHGFDVISDPVYSNYFWQSGVHIKLVNDIDLNGVQYSCAVIAPHSNDQSGYDFEGEVYSGIFDGNGFTISNFSISYVEWTNQRYLGLFGKTDNAIIKNLSIDNVSLDVISSVKYVGGICGYSNASEIVNCNSNVAINKLNEGGDYIGGICGYNESGSITGCSTECTISGKDYVGGVCGFNNGKILKNVANCNIESEDYTGGFCGYNIGSIDKSYAKGAVLGFVNTGGFCGCSEGQIVNSYSITNFIGGSYTGGFIGNLASGNVFNSYSAGEYIGTGYAGGFVGKYDGGEVNGCFWDIDVTGLATSSKGVGKTTSELTFKATFVDAGWDFINEQANGTDDIWCMRGYPVITFQVDKFVTMPDLSGLTQEEAEETIDLTGLIIRDVVYEFSDVIPSGYILSQTPNAGDLAAGDSYVDIMVSMGPCPINGSGSGNDPFVISDIDGFDLFANRSYSSIYMEEGVVMRLDTNIDLTGRVYNNSVVSSSFRGIFDGNGYAIKNLTITDVNPGVTKIGLFSSMDVNNSEVKDLIIENVFINAPDSDDVGVVCGISSGGNNRIRNCYVTGNVIGNSNVGGIMGRCFDGIISDCSFEGIVDGVANIGGIVGFNYRTDITKSYVNCTVGNTGSEYCGGLCGYNFAADINYCKSSGSVIGSMYIGGFCGFNENQSNYVDHYIIDCYSSSSVNGNNYVGGFCGYNYSYSYIENCYSFGEVVDSGQANVGGFCGISSANRIINCFWDMTSSNMPSDHSAAIGKTTADMYDVNTFLDASWNFSVTNNKQPDWYMPKHGYPKLLWEFPIVVEGETTINKDTLLSPEVIELNLYSKDGQQYNWTLSGFENCLWITDVSPASGTSNGPEDVTNVLVEVDQFNLSPGNYFSEIIVTLNNNDKISIPIALNYSNIIDLDDFAALSQCWLASGLGNGSKCSLADWYEDDNIDLNDFYLLAEFWLDSDISRLNPVEMEEFAILSQYWLSEGCFQGTLCSKADYFIDGKIDINDLGQLMVCWLDDEMVYVDSWQEYFEEFSMGLPEGENWDFVSTNTGVVEVTDQRLRMHCSDNGSYSLNEAIFHIDLEGQKNIMLSFWQSESNDEIDNLPLNFTDYAIGDGVAVSSDGSNWTTIFNATDLDVGELGQVFTFDLDSIGLDYTSDFQIKFQQYDNYTWDTDGREWDNIRVYKSEEKL